MRKETFNRALVLSLAASMMASTTPLQPIQVKAASEETQVKKNDALALTLNYSTYTVKKGETLKLKASISQATEKNKKVTWHTSDKTIVSVTQDGVVTGVKKGKATITAQIDGTKVKAKCMVTVGTAITGLTVKENASTVKEGKTLKLEAAITPSNASNKKLTYTSSDKTVATVSSAGVVTAKKPGKAVITIKTTDGSAKTAKVTVTVEEAVTDLVITKNSLKNNKLTITGGVYNNITIENSVGSQAAIYFKNIKVKGNLILQDGVDYNVAINMASNVANVICTSDVAGAQKGITKLSTEGKKSPIFKVKGSSIVGKIVVDKAYDFALISNKKADVKEVEVIHEANKKTDLSLSAYRGKLTVQGAEKGELNVILAGSEIPAVSIEGTATNQKVTLNATTTSTLKKIEANAPSSQVIINGVNAKVSELITNAKGVLVSILEKANVGNIIIKGENTSVNVDKGSSIDNIDVQEKGGTIKGEGAVEKVDVSADGTKIETVGTKVEVSNGVDGTIAGGIGLNGGAEITTGNASSDSSASGSSSGGNSDGGSSSGGSSGGGDTVWNPEFEAAVSELRKILDNYAEPTKLLDGVTLQDIEKAQALVDKVSQIYRPSLQKKVDLAKEFLKERTLKEIEEAEKAIQIQFAEGDSETSVTSAFELPKTGLHGTKIIWESNSDAVLIKDGVVTIQRPLYVDGNKEVVLSAIVQKDGIQSATAVMKKVVILSVDKTALQGAIITIKEATTKEDIKKILDNPEYVAALELNVTGFDILVETEQDTVLQSIVDWETRKDFGIEIGSSLERAKKQFNQKWNELVSKEETDNQKEKDSKDIQEALDLLDTYIFDGETPDDRVKELTESITLPTTHGNDVSVQWTVKKTETSPAKTGNFDNNGTVVRPDYSEGVDGYYTLTAVCTKGIGEVENNEKVYNIVIKKAEANPEQKAIEAVKIADTKEAVKKILENEEYVKVIGLDLSTYKNLSDTYKERIQTGLAEWTEKKDLGIVIGGNLVQAKAAVVAKFNALVTIQVEDMGQEDANKDIKDALEYVDKVIFGEGKIPEDRERVLEESIVLPTISDKNVSITWSVEKLPESAQTGSFDDKGNVIRPDYAKGVDGRYILTATCTKEPGSVEPNTRTYQIKITKEKATIEQRAIEGIKSANNKETVKNILDTSTSAIALNLNMDTYAVYKRLDSNYQESVQIGLAEWEEKKDLGLELGTGQSLEQAREAVKTKFDELVKIQTDDIENKKANEAVQKALEYIDNELLKTAEEKESRTKTVIKDILLPTTYEGVTITWTANKAANNEAETGNIDNTGTVVRPDYAGKEDAIYTLTATCTKELSTVTENKKEFTIIITKKEASSIQNAIEKFTTAESIADMKLAISNAELGLDVANMKMSLGEDSSYYNAVLEALIKMDKTGLKLDEGVTLATKIVIQAEFNKQVKRQIEFKAVVDKANTSLEKAENTRNSFKDIYEKNEEKFTEVEKTAAKKNLANLETAQKALEEIVKTEIENQTEIQAATNTLDEKIVNLEKNIDTLKIILVVADNLTLESLKTESDTSNIVDKTLQIVTAADLKLPRTIGEDKDKLEITWSSSDEKIIQTKTVSGEDVKYEHVIVNPKYTHNANADTIESLTGEANKDDYTPVVLTAIVTSAIGGEAKAVNFNIEVREAKSNLNYIVDIGKGSLSVDGNAAINTKKDISGTTTEAEEKEIVENLSKSQKIINVPNTTTVKEFVDSLVISNKATVTITKDGVILANDSTERLEASKDKYKVFVTPENGNELEKREYSVVVLKKAISKAQVAKAEKANYESKKYVDNSTAIDMEFKEDGDNTIAITATDGLSASTEGSKKRMVGIVVDFADCVVDPTEITNLTEMKAEVLEGTKVVFWIEADNANGEEITQTIHYTVQFKDNDTLPLTFTYAPTEKTIGTQYVDSAIKNMNEEFFTAIFGAATADGYKVPLKNGEEEITNVTLPSAISGDLIQGEETATGELPVKLTWEFTEADGNGKATIKPDGKVVRPVYTDGDKNITVKIVVDYIGAIPGGNGQQQAIQKDMSIDLVIEKTAATPVQTAVEEFNKLFANTPTIEAWNTYLTQYAEELGVQMADTSNADGTIFGYNSLPDNYKKKVLDACVAGVDKTKPYDYTLDGVNASKTTISTLINGKIEEQVINRLTEDAQNYVNALTYDKDIKSLNANAEESNQITKDFALPTTDSDKITGMVYNIAWTASGSAIVIENGTAKVTRPEYKETLANEEVTLHPTVTFKYAGDKTLGKEDSASKIKVTVLQKEATDLQKAIVAANALNTTTSETDWNQFLTDHASILKLEVENTIDATNKVTSYGYNSLSDYYKKEVKAAFIDGIVKNGPYTYDLTITNGTTTEADESQKAIKALFNVSSQFVSMREDAQNYVDGLTYDKDIKTITTNTEEKEAITKDFTLPLSKKDDTKGVEYEIAWETASPSAISVEGATAKVTRPVYSAETKTDETVTLIPTISLKGFTDVEENTGITKETTSSAIEVTVLMAEASKEQKAIVALREAIKGTDEQTDNDKIAAVKSVLETSDYKDIFNFGKYAEYTDLKKETAYEKEADTVSYQNAVAKAVFKLGTSKLDYTLKEVQNTLQTIRTAFDNQVTYEVSLKEEVTTAFENIKKAEDKLQEMITAGKYNSGTEEDIKKVTEYVNLAAKIETTKNEITSAKATLENKISDITKAIKAMNDYVENEVQIYIDTQYVAGVKTKITKKDITFEFGKDAEDNNVDDAENSVSSIFTLPTNDSPEIKDLTIKWASKTTTATGGAITINAEGNQVESITRPKYTDGNGTVILTATITRGKQTETAERTLTIKKKQGTASQVAVEEINSATNLTEIADAITKNYILYGINKTDYDTYNGTAFDGNITIDGVTYIKREIVQAIVGSGIEYSVELVTDNGNETEEAVGAAKIGEAFKVAYTAVLKYTEADTKKSDYINTAVTSIKDSVYKNVESPYSSIGVYFKKAMKKETGVNIADITTQVETIQTALEALQTSIDAANEAVKQVASLIDGNATDINKVTNPDTIALKDNMYYKEINNVLDKLHTSCGGTVSETPADATCYFETESTVLLDAVAVLKSENNKAILEKVNNLVDKNADSKITDFKDGFKFENIETIPGTKVSTSTASGSSITASGSAIVIDVLSMESEAIYTTATGGAATVTEIQDVFGTVKEFYNNQQILRSQFGVIFDTDFGSSNMEGKLTGSLAAEKVKGVNAGATYADINALIDFLENKKLAASTKNYYTVDAVAKGKLLWNQELEKQINNLFMGGDVLLGIAEETTIQDIRDYKEKVENEFFTDIDTDSSFQDSLKNNLNTLTTLYCNRMKTNAISAQGVMNKLVTGEIVDGKIQWADGIGDLALSQIYDKIGQAEESIENIMSGLDASEAGSTDIGDTYKEVEKINTELQLKLVAAKNTYDADAMGQVKALYKSPTLPSLDDIALKDEQLVDGVQKATIETLVTDAAKAFNEATRKEVTGYADMALDIYVRTEKAFELLDKVSKLVVIEPEGTNVIGLAEDATFNSINVVVQEFALAETEFNFTEKDKEKAGKFTLDIVKDLWNEKVKASIDTVYDKETGFKTQDKTVLNSVLEKVTDVFTGLDSTPEISPEDVQKEWNEAIYSNLKGLVTSINVDTSAASGSMITVGELTDPNIDVTVISPILSQASESGLFDVTISVDGNDYTREMLIELSQKILIVWKNTPQSTSYAVQQIADILDLDLDKVESENELQNSEKNETVTQPEKEEPTETPEVPEDETPVETPAPEVPKDETPVETPTPEVPKDEILVETPTPEDETSVETPTPETSGEVETNK